MAAKAFVKVNHSSSLLVKNPPSVFWNLLVTADMNLQQLFQEIRPGFTLHARQRAFFIHDPAVALLIGFP